MTYYRFRARMSPIPLILEFKEKRRPELARLRAELDGLSQYIAIGRQLPKAKETAIERVRDAVADTFRVMSERFETEFARRFGMSISLGTLRHNRCNSRGRAPAVAVVAAEQV